MLRRFETELHRASGKRPLTQVSAALGLSVTVQQSTSAGDGLLHLRLGYGPNSAQLCPCPRKSALDRQTYVRSWVRNDWALGPTEWFSRPAQGLGLGSFAVPVSPVRQSVEGRVAVGRATGTQDSKPRFGLTSCGRKVGSPKITAQFENVCSCLPDRHVVGDPCPIHGQR